MRIFLDLPFQAEALGPNGPDSLVSNVIKQDVSIRCSNPLTLPRTVPTSGPIDLKLVAERNSGKRRAFRNITFSSREFMIEGLAEAVEQARDSLALKGG